MQYSTHFFNVLRLMNYVEYKKQHYSQVELSEQKCDKYSNEMCTLLQFCKKKWGWIPDPTLFHVRGQ